MRKLTIVRSKKFVGCASRTQIYMEDPLSGGVKIKGVSCKKVGDIKNGGSLAFDIPNDQVKIFALTGFFGKKCFNELYLVPEGEEDVTLRGMYTSDPLNGNPFVFLNNTSREAIQNRVENSKFARLYVIVGGILGCGIGAVIGYIGSGCLSYLMF
jgi:hypothetical protein